ncbi:bifunctional glutamate N-acetyltransferase/amino-acid acetyltransferase ArgJ [Paenibacillus alkalitolerans]|uniref:bifunctional glutamate N-acetyltransferase/amino-acid acetyltransferase ArgJ n=1 Tax=Paenibacillus alkalitolerans TaxID=2799335 RepID=UPI0018F38ED3|nr:bifunctional glutamate N-acetyltransferase/amino-acid acetyltransferase ArgJ [Paenibacillus alkalitolerans]
MIGQKGFALAPEGTVTTPKGFKAGGVHCGIKKVRRYDLGAIVCDVPAMTAAVYTTNLVQAAPLAVTRESIAREGRLRAMLVNSGNANACTGERGFTDAREMRSAFAAALGVPDHLVGVTSTGVIGVHMPMDKVRAGVGALANGLSPDGGGDFCQAIMTTDLVQKSVCVRLEAGGAAVTIAGAAKGSGMIHPNMATMLGFITTDAALNEGVLQSLLSETTDVTFNMITVDGDTSTNDMVVAMASGLAGNEPLHPGHPDWECFAAAFRCVSETLAKEIARDGEGATKLIEVNVSGARTDQDARAVAKTIVGSSLVKSAMYGSDANWGRIIAAAGRAGVPIDANTVDIRLGDIPVLQASVPIPFDEAAAKRYLDGSEIAVYVDLHIGPGKATAWGCDLTYDYVKINASYRT